MLNSITDYYKKSKTSRGSALYTDEKGISIKGLEEIFNHNVSDISILSDEIQEINKDKIKWRKVRPIPQSSECFENVWKSFRENKNIN